MQTVTFDNWPYHPAIAHRGAGKLAPENTLASMRLGFSHGYRMFEFDVKLTADGKLVLLHDDTLDRTTNTTGRLSKLTLAELMQVDAGSWHSDAYAGETIPTLLSVVRYLLANHALINIEIKPTTGREKETGAVVALDAAELWKNEKIPPLLSSFSTEALLAAKEAAPHLPRAHLFEDPLPADWLARCKEVDAVAFNPNQRSLNESLVRLAHEHKLRVVTYTVNEADKLETLKAWGVDGWFTDKVDIFEPIFS